MLPDLAAASLNDYKAFATEDAEVTKLGSLGFNC